MSELKVGCMILSTTQLGPGNDKRPFLESLKMIAEAGYDYVSLLANPGGPTYRRSYDPPASFIDVFQSDKEDLLAIIRDHGLELKHIHAGGLLLDTDEHAAHFAEELAQLALLSRDYGCEAMGFGIGPAFDPGTPHKHKLPYLDRCIRAYDRIGEILEDAPIRVGADIHFRAPLEHVEDAAYVLERTQQRKAGLCLNMGHLATVGAQGWELIERFPESIVISAYKDHVVPKDGAPSVISKRLGAGDTPLGKYVKRLKDQAVETYHVISIEHEPWDEKQESIAESLAYLRELWAQGGEA